MGQFCVVVSDHLHPSGWGALAQAEDVALAGPFAGRDELLAALAGADGLIVRSRTQVDAELLAAAPRLKAVARAGAHLGNIDIEAATRLGIMVINAPEANLVAVTEHTFAMLLALARGIPAGDQAVRSGQWPRHAMLGFQLHGKQLGVIGFGRLGREVAARAQAFGMRVLAYDPYIDLAFARARGVEMVNFAELLARADIVSLHTAYTPQTQHMLGAAEFAQMKRGAYLVNCAHAGLVDEAALAEALDSGQLAGAAIDTFAEEPPPLDHPLLRHPGVVLAPHLNQNTVESQAATSLQVAEDLLGALRNADYRHVVNLPFNEAQPYQLARPFMQLATQLGKLQGQLAGGWITRLEVEVIGEELRQLVRPVAAGLLAGMLRPVNGRAANWVSAPALACEQQIGMAQVKGLVEPENYPNLIACRISWEGSGGAGSRVVAGAILSHGEARLVQYDHFHIDALPQGYVLILENEDVPGVIGKVGTRLGRAGINIAQWRYGRQVDSRRAVSFLNLDSRPPAELLAELEKEPEIYHARRVHL
jgi:D-3-phosphoglycerate dehydrogenase